MPVPRPRSPTRKIREILRLALGAGLSRRATGAATVSTFAYAAYTVVLTRFFMNATQRRFMDVVPGSADFVEAARVAVRTARESLGRAPSGDAG